MIIIGVDLHKSSHTATAVDPATNTPVASLRIDASLAGYRQLPRWTAQFTDRRWAIENARCLGRHLAQWLVARDEVVWDVSATATARVRELSRGGRRKNEVARLFEGVGPALATSNFRMQHSVGFGSGEVALSCVTV